MHKARLVKFKTKDKLLLPGLLLEPARKTRRVAINLHGNGSSSVFYSVDQTNAFAKELNKRGIAYFPFNNRGAHYVKKLTVVKNGEKDKVKIGTAYELIKDCIKDIDAAIEFLEGLGFSEFYLLGHSTGANKICVYNYYKPENKIAKYVMFGGGDDTGLFYDWVGGAKKFKKYLKLAKEQIKRGNGRKLIPKYIVDYTLSYQSFYDTCNPDGDYNIFPFNEYINNLKLSRKPLFREYKLIKKPTLVVYGENDEYCYGDVGRIIDILKKEALDIQPFDFKVIKEADHGFTDYEDELAEVVAKWLSKHGKKN